MSRFPKKHWREFSPSTLNIAKSIAKAAVHPSIEQIEDVTISRGPFKTKLAAQIYRGEWFRFRETLRVDHERRADRYSQEGRLYSILELLTSMIESRPGLAPDAPYQWWVDFCFHPHVIDHWRHEPEIFDAAIFKHKVFLAAEGEPTDDPDVLQQVARLSDKAFDKFALSDIDAHIEYKDFPKFTPPSSPQATIDTSVEDRQAALRAEYERQQKSSRTC